LRLAHIMLCYVAKGVCVAWAPWRGRAWAVGARERVHNEDAPAREGGGYFFTDMCEIFSE